MHNDQHNQQYSENILVPVVTPFNQDFAVCESSVANIIERIRPFAEGFLPCLTSGEGWCLNQQQWQDMVRYSINKADGLKVVVGIEKATTAQVLEYALFAQSLGADGIMVTTEFGESVTQAQMLSHFETIHQQTTLPIWIYHETALSNNNMSLETLLTIADMPKVVGIKDSGPDTSVGENVATLGEKGVSIYNGWEDRMVANLHPCGNIVSLSNLMPEVCYQATKAGELNPRQSNINTLCEQYGLLEDDWYKYVKASLFEQGVISSPFVVADQPQEESANDDAKAAVPA